MARIERISNEGYTVTVMWECNFNDILIQYPELKYHPYVKHDPLNTRDSLYGGRCEAMRLYHKKEKIGYVDVMSLYPWVCKYFKFPVGHTTVHDGDVCNDIDHMLRKEGIIKAKILPPRKLYHPVLPFKCHKKLIFSLCRSCTEELSDVCDHKTVD